MKNKKIAGFFALFFGVFGMHRFYLGQRFLGILYFVAFFFGLTITVEEGVPMVVIPAMVAFIDSILFFAMPQEDFDAKYNSRKTYMRPFRKDQKGRADFKRAKKTDRFKRSGIEKFRDFDYEGAIEDFKKSLKIKYNAPSTHFNLACCYALLEDTAPAFFHLDKAVEFGFVDFEKIYRHDALAFLRVQTEFENFVKNGYRLTPSLPAPKEDLLSSSPSSEKTSEPDLLEQILRLGDLRDKGILTEEEFSLQKKKLLEGQ